jgi:DNA-binding transcriptional LysR family regulator
MVLSGLGFTYIPEYAVTVPGLVTRPLVEPEVFRTVSLVTVRGRPHSPAVGACVRAAKGYGWTHETKPSYGAVCAMPTANGRLQARGVAR